MVALTKRKREREREPKTTSGSMSPEFLRRVRLVAAHLGIGNAEVLDRFARPALDKVLKGLKVRT